MTCYVVSRSVVCVQVLLYGTGLFMEHTVAFTRDAVPIHDDSRSVVACSTASIYASQLKRHVVIQRHHAVPFATPPTQSRAVDNTVSPPHRFTLTLIQHALRDTRSTFHYV